MNTRERKEYQAVVSHPFQVFNGIFLTLPLDGIRQTGLRVPLLQEACEAGLERSESPVEILEEFFRSQGLADREDQTALLFRIIQYVERQVVLVDALEDARYAHLNDLGGAESLQSLMQRTRRHGLSEELKAIMHDYAVRVVLTAHPTQFYPGNALAIITDLAQAMEQNDLVSIRKLLHQLGLTPFFQSEPPTPFDEAVRQSWYLEHVFYSAAPELYMRVAQALDDPEATAISDGLIAVGFWPGGDRDGNPFVDAETTRAVAKRLRVTLLRCYRRDLRDLRRRVTFKHTSAILDELQNQVEAAMLHPDTHPLRPADLLEPLAEVAEWVESQYNGLYLEAIRMFQFKVRLFGMHFASIDIRQDSRVLKAARNEVLEACWPGGVAAFEALPLEERVDQMLSWQPELTTELAEERHRDALQSLAAMRDIQQTNGAKACHRFIISNCRGAEDVAGVLLLARAAGWEDPESVDVVPLFETIDDLARAKTEMQWLYAQPRYRQHLDGRKSRQTIMLGFSDGTKDGGYLRANWSIYQAKEGLTQISREAGVTALFFDGRGGPPARGGGNTHRFYASLGDEIENREIQTTIQGQTISSNFGIPRSATFNMELLLTAGLQNRLFGLEHTDADGADARLMDELSETSFAHYQRLKTHPAFMAYLETYGTLRYYGETNVGSRPTRRQSSGPLTLDDLRAIPFVGSWSQLRQNVPGYYGLGTALEALEQQGRLDEATRLYEQNAFFRALVENSMQSMLKCDFRLTAHLASHPEFGGLWTQIFEEFERTKRLVLLVSGQSALMERNPAIRESIGLRDGLIKPLLVIQQFALMKRAEGASGWEDETLKRLIIRSMFGIINASRNAV